MSTAQAEITEIVNEIVEFNKFDAQLSEYKKQFKDIVYDLTNSEQQALAKADKKAITKVIKSLDATHKSVKSDLLSKTRLIDGERKRIKDDLTEIKDDITAQEDEHASIAIKHAALLHEKIEYIEKMAVADIGMDSLDELNIMLNATKEIVVDDSYESREADGHMAKAKAIESLEGQIALAEKRAKEVLEAKELQDKEQAIREEQIRKDATAQAEKQKEAAALQAKKDAETAKKKAEADKKAAVKAEKQKAEKAAQQKEAAAREEVERLQALADVEAKKVKAKQENQAHRKQVHQESKISFIAAGFNNGTELVTAIKDGKIKNVIITY